MKKYVLIIIFTLFAFKTYACKCITQSIENNYIQSDFVAKVKILKKHPNIENSNYYKADIQVLDLYKGNASKSIFIYGNYKESQDSACWIYTDENEVLVVYAKTINGNQQLDMCASVLRINKKTNSNTTNQRYNKELDVLEALKSNKVSFTSDIKFKSIDFNTISRENYGIDLKRKFAIYELTFNENQSVKCIKEIEGFKNKVDKKIKKFLKKSKWSSTTNYTKNKKIPKNSKTLIIIYYKLNVESNKGYIINRL